MVSVLFIPGKRLSWNIKPAEVANNFSAKWTDEKLACSLMQIDFWVEDKVISFVARSSPWGYSSRVAVSSHLFLSLLHHEKKMIITIIPHFIYIVPHDNEHEPGFSRNNIFFCVYFSEHGGSRALVHWSCFRTSSVNFSFAMYHRYLLHFMGQVTDSFIIYLASICFTTWCCSNFSMITISWI